MSDTSDTNLNSRSTSVSETSDVGLTNKFTKIELILLLVQAITVLTNGGLFVKFIGIEDIVGE